MIICHKDMELDDRINVAAILKFLSDTRQAAYNLSRDTSALLPAYERAEEAYRQFTDDFGIEYREVFDAVEYASKRQAAGDALYEDWKRPARP
mgnify:CR=1 FL=1